MRTVQRFYRNFDHLSRMILARIDQIPRTPQFELPFNGNNLFARGASTEVGNCFGRFAGGFHVHFTLIVVARASRKQGRILPD